MRYTWLLSIVLAGVLAACQAERVADGAASHEERGGSIDSGPGAAPRDGPAGEAGEARTPAASTVDLEALARRPQGEETVCRAFAREIAQAALRHGNDTDAFLVSLQEEFVGGKDNPFDLKAGLREGSWNQRYFYAGHGGFRPEYDDAQRYPRGGNHQPGHFVSVFSIAAQFGEEQASIAIAAAGDYEEGDEDDLRLSRVAIPLGAGLRDGTVTTAEVAQRARELCR